ncbi:hypothetical protein [Pedobacter faecalis]|uniref:hypothetical protein n=1 Tax=Pedobacter faecalis TaxID=3041495 RepID=UPI0025517217|nr:hypothetical protein [Pedobacter sp. ELA7]
MKRFIRLTLSIVCCVLGLAASAQDVRVAAVLDTGVIALGDQTVLRLSAEVVRGKRVSLPALTDTISSKIVIAAAGKADTSDLKNGQDLIRIEQAYTITSFEPGLHQVPGFTFEADGKTYTTDPLPLQVTSVQVDTTKAIFDIKQPLGVSYTFLDWLSDNKVLVGAGLLLILLLGLLWYYFRRRKPAEKPVPQEPVLAAHVEALQKLDELNAKKLWQQGQVKAFYSDLTEILKIYLERRFRISAQEHTTDEILNALKGLEKVDGDLSAADRAALGQILSEADLVKFAKAVPAPGENDLRLAEAIAFVRATQLEAADHKGGQPR